MKNIINKIGLLAITSILFTACNDDDFTGASQINYSSPTNVTLTVSDNDVIIMESQIDEAVFDVTATIPEAVPVDLVIDLEQTAGNADSSDYELSTITISAGTTSGTGTITIFPTGDIEGDETLSIGASAGANYQLSPFTFNANITDDYINDVLDLTLSWDGTASSGDVSIDSFCGIDFDLILYDDAFGYLGYVLGTADCPEHTGLSGLPDGTYYLVTDLYDNPLASYGFTDTIPLTLTWFQEYVDDAGGSITSDAYNLSMTSGLGGMIVVLEVSGYNYTLSPF